METESTSARKRRAELLRAKEAYNNRNKLIALIATAVLIIGGISVSRAIGGGPQENLCDSNGIWYEMDGTKLDPQPIDPCR